MNINDLLQGPLRDLMMDQVNQKFQINDTQEANTAVNGVLAALMNGLAHNASTPEGASSLMSAIDRDHDGSILNDVVGFFNGTTQFQNSSTANGLGILNHIFGDKTEAAAQAISKNSGIDTGKILQLMMTFAPIVLGFLGKNASSSAQTQSAPSQGGGLLDILNGATKTVNQQPTNQGLLSKLLDRDGDGNVMDDIADMGFRTIMGKFLGK
ncbi:MAG: DUF937 domain-containing protein [Saprospiraceae bacterium]